MNVTYTVWHRLNTRDNDDDALLAQFPEGFVRVAVVTAPSLDAVFELTNHIDRPWTQNAGVEPEGPGSKRSTSVGDVVLDVGASALAAARGRSGAGRWVVDPVGFRQF